MGSESPVEPSGRIIQDGQGGSPPALEPFKKTWKDLQFSHVFSAVPKGVDHRIFVQRLFDVCFRIHNVSMEEQDLHLLVEELRNAAIIQVDSDNLKALKEFWDSWLLLCSLYCLFCLFEAQPAQGRVVIRVDDHHFDVFKRMFDLVDTDAKRILHTLWQNNAFCLGVSQTVTSLANHNSSHPLGAGIGAVTPGMDPLEAVTLRESRYHLDSTLRGLGTHYVEAMCSKYRNALTNVMIDKPVDDSPESYNLKGIADLNFGHEIHRNVTFAAEKIQYLLHDSSQRGRNGKSSSFAKTLKPKPSGKSGAQAVFEREAARARDISTRKRQLEEQIGLIREYDDEEHGAHSSSSDDSDMPDLIVICSHDGKYNSRLIRHKNTPLKFARILCTAPRQYYDRLASCVVHHGGRPAWIPGIEIAGLSSTEAIKERNKLLERFSSAKYLVLPSKNAIYSCLDMCHGNLDDLQKLLHGFEIWAMGADADFLNSLGIDNVRKPEISSTIGIVDAMKRLYGSRLAETCLVFAPEVVSPLTEPDVVPNFLRGLQDIGLAPVRVPAYETRIGPDITTGSPEVDMLVHGHIAAIAFTSTAESEGLMNIVGREKLLEAIQEYNILLAAHGPTTAKGVQNVLGQQVDCVSKDSATFDGMITAISEKLDILLL